MEIAAMLKEYVGKWRSEGTIYEGDSKQPASATWECKPWMNGPGNVCVWHHEWADRPPDSAMEIMGYDEQRHSMSVTRIEENGIINDPALLKIEGNKITRDWTFESGGKTGVGHNEIIVKKSGFREQHFTIRVDGKLVWGFDVTQRRVD